MTTDFQARREALANDDLNGRADLMADDSCLAMMRAICDHDELLEDRRLVEFGDRLHRELRDRLRAEKEFIFLTEITTQEEMRQEVEDACIASQRVFAAALDAAQSACPLPSSKSAAFAELRKRAADEGLDSPAMVAEREAWLAGLPKCRGCGK